jgi:hypothetical protein
VLFTLYRVGKELPKPGSWESEESVIALNAVDGKTLWEYKYPFRAIELPLRRRTARVPAGRRQSRVHGRHQQADSRLRQSDR